MVRTWLIACVLISCGAVGTNMAVDRDIIDAVAPVVEVLERLNVAYHIGGSVASSAYGIARTTLDVDLMADLHPELAHSFVEQLEASHYVDENMVEDAIRQRSSFNLIHLATMVKIDVFISKGQAFDLSSFQRARQRNLADDSDKDTFYLASPEDVVLRKLEWYSAGGGISERQWKDVLGILKVQAASLDRAYLKQWAERLGLQELLDKAIREADI